MSQHSSATERATLAEDHDMDDLIDLNEVLPVEEALAEQSDASHDDAAAVSTNTRARSEHSPATEGAAPAEDSDMDDVNDITGALDAATEVAEQIDAAHDDTAARLRLELYASMFAAQPVEPRHIENPSQCSQYPEQTHEITSTYLSHTTFSVKIWLNYDTIENVFFEGARAPACGKLRLPEDLHQGLANMDPNFLKFQHIRFEIATPFRSLATMKLDVEHDAGGATLHVNGRIGSEQGGKKKLSNYLTWCLRRIRYLGLMYNTEGLTLQDLEAFASLFRRDHEQYAGRDDDWEQPKYGGGEWAGVEQPKFQFGGVTWANFQSR